MSIVAISIAIERFLVYRKLRLSDFKDRKSLEHELTKKLHIIATIGANALLEKLMGDVTLFVGGAKQHDDLTLIVVKVE